jgi:hypothetical protein
MENVLVVGDDETVGESEQYMRERERANEGRGRVNDKRTLSGPAGTSWLSGAAPAHTNSALHSAHRVIAMGIRKLDTCWDQKLNLHENIFLRTQVGYFFYNVSICMMYFNTVECCICNAFGDEPIAKIII